VIKIDQGDRIHWQTAPNRVSLSRRRVSYKGMSRLVEYWLSGTVVEREETAMVEVVFVRWVDHSCNIR